MRTRSSAGRFGIALLALAWLSAAGCATSGDDTPPTSGAPAPPRKPVDGGGAGPATSGASAGDEADDADDAEEDSGAGTESSIRTVFLILMENKVWAELDGNPDAPYLNDVLLPQASVALNYKGPKDGTLHPSEPNYLWLEAGTDFGVADNHNPSFNHQNTTNHLVSRLERAGISWKSYQEDIRGDECALFITGAYDPKHNPMVFFDDVTDGNDVVSPHCIEHVRPLDELAMDLRDERTVARYNFITPNLCNDMHSACDPQNNLVRQGDNWLARWIPRIQASAAYQHGGAIFITWDEADTTSDCPQRDCEIGMFVLSSLAKGHGYTNSIAYDHSSTLKTMQEIFGVKPLMRAAAGLSVEDLSDLFHTFP